MFPLQREDNNSNHRSNVEALVVAMKIAEGVAAEVIVADRSETLNGKKESFKSGEYPKPSRVVKR